MLAVSLVTFVLVSVSPIDPVQANVGQTAYINMSEAKRAQLAEYWGVNTPLWERYANWFVDLLHGDLGTSLRFNAPVIDVIATRAVNSLALMATAWAVSGVLGFALGILAGANRGRLIDRIVKGYCFLLASVPTFWLGLLFLLIFAVWLGWFPVGFSAPVGVLSENVTLWQKLHHLLLPALTLSLTSFANIALHTRQKLVEVLSSEYVLFARARGETPREILRRHGLRNILIPALTLQFASFAELFGGSVLAENVFSYPGLGSAAAAAGLQGDVPLLLGITLFSALFVSVGNLIADLLYGVVDPRVREVGA